MSGSISDKKANVKDVARRAGVSVATVSRVVNGASAVSNVTRTRVEQAIEELRYVRSSAAMAINTGRTRLVGALIPTLDQAIFARFIDNLEEELDKHDLSLIVSRTAEDTDRELDRAKKLLDLGVEGLIVSGVTRSKGFDSLIARYQVPVIATSYYQEDYLYPTIGYDNTASAMMAYNHLHNLGHSKIAVLSGRAQGNDRIAARIGGLQSVQKHNMKFWETNLDFGSAAIAVTQILERHNDFTAILCLSDVLAQGVLIKLKSMGVDVPNDVSVIGIDDLPNSKDFDPPLTTVHLPVGQMGQTTASALVNWIEHGQRPSNADLTTYLEVRGTTLRHSGGFPKC